MDGELADLKCQSTPFFRAGDLFGFDPRFAVTFNKKDYQRYCEQYPAIVIYYWVAWIENETTIRGQLYSVEPMRGVWRVSLETLRERITAGTAPLHAYQQRVGDTRGNAKDSFVFDLRTFEQLGYVEGLRRASQRRSL